jgi:hypothetical protein
MNKLNTLADFKRALQTPGVQLETLALAYGFTNSPASIQEGRLRVGMVRYVNKCDTTGVYLKENEGDQGRGSFLGYDKAGDWVFTEDIATNTKWGYAYRVLMPVSAEVA